MKITIAIPKRATIMIMIMMAIMQTYDDNSKHDTVHNNDSTGSNSKINFHNNHPQHHLCQNQNETSSSKKQKPMASRTQLFSVMICCDSICVLS